MSLPKPDQRTLDALGRLKNLPDFQLYAKHQHALLEHIKEMLLTSKPEETQPLQGRALQLQDTLKLLNKEQK